MASLQIEKPATAMPVTLTEAKNFLRVDINDDDLLITAMLQAATEACENFTNRSFCIKGFRQSLDSFPYFTDTTMSQAAYPPSYYALPRYSTTLWNYSQMIKLFRPPLVSVDRISYLSSSDQQWHDLVPSPPLWYPARVYALNALVMDNNANVQKCVFAGTSDSNPPKNWNKAINGVTVETSPDTGGEGSGPVQWQNQGPFAATTPDTTQGQFGAYIIDLDSEPARIFPGPPGFFWPPVLYVPNSVQIHFTAGFSVDGTQIGDGIGQMPACIKIAILQCVANWYENREASMLGSFGELPFHCQMLLWSKKVIDYQPTRG
jgi:hypothetical protein